MFTPRILITPGEPAGIGPDIALMAAQQSFSAELIFVSDLELLRQRADILGLDLTFEEVDLKARRQRHRPGHLTILPVDLGGAETSPGQPNVAHAHYVLHCLDEAKTLCLKREADALVTGPVAKFVINEAGIPFQGHTEYLADGQEVLMMLTDGKLRVALLTTHVPLMNVKQYLSIEHLRSALNLLNEHLKKKKTCPNILVCAFNPHAGEQGHLGREEIDIMIPALNEAKQQGINVRGPISTDTVFTPPYLKWADAILTIYHDQGLPTLKALSFGEIMNITLGLPFLRTSVDHGTAFEWAGTGQAKPDSLLKVIHETIKMVRTHV